MNKSTADFQERCLVFSENCTLFLEELHKNAFYRPIINQSTRSTTSIGANIAESKCSKTRIEFARYYEISLKSGNESVYWLSLLKRTACRNNTEKIDVLLGELNQLNRIIAASLKTMRKNNQQPMNL
jgi:four helix bundle protein